MDESYLKSKQYIFIAAIFMLAAVVCGVAFLNIPIIKKVFEKKDVLEAKKLEFSLLEDQANQSSRYINLVESFSEDRSLIENATIKADSVVQFIEEIEGIANVVGVEIEIANQEVSKQKKKTSSVPASISESDPADAALAAKSNSTGQETEEMENVNLKVVVTGNYRQFLQFYYRLENMPYIFSIDSFGIEKVTSKSSPFGASQETDKKDEIDLVKGEVGISFTAK